MKGGINHEINKLKNTLRPIVNEIVKINPKFIDKYFIVMEVNDNNVIIKEFAEKVSGEFKLIEYPFGTKTVIKDKIAVANNRNLHKLKEDDILSYVEATRFYQKDNYLLELLQKSLKK